MVKLNAAQLRKGSPSLKLRRIKRSDIYIVLDNVLDTYNIGSIFRLADAVVAKKIYLCGGTETPPNHRIKKASINTTEVVEWEYKETALEALTAIRRQSSDVQIIAVEQASGSVQYNNFEYKLPVCLVVGHESDGVSKEVLDISDAIVELPMFGINKSLNVMVSLGIVLYEVIEKTKGREPMSKKLSPDDDLRVIDQSFDLALSNPPFHEKYGVLIDIFRQVKDKLSKNGQFYIVVEKTFL